MCHGKVHGQSPEAAVAGQTKRRMFVENFSIQVDTDVGFHVFWTIVENLDKICLELRILRSHFKEFRILVHVWI